MKKLMIILLLGSTLLSFAQNEGKQKQMHKDFSPEQHATLQTKKMTLALDLNENQQKQMLLLNKKWAEEKAKKKAEMKNLNFEEMTSTEKFNHKNAMLDAKIAHQNEVKKILNEEQYSTWKKTSNKRHNKSKKGSGHQHAKGRKGQK